MYPHSFSKLYRTISQSEINEKKHNEAFLDLAIPNYLLSFNATKQLTSPPPGASKSIESPAVMLKSISMNTTSALDHQEDQKIVTQSDTEVNKKCNLNMPSRNDVIALETTPSNRPTDVEVTVLDRHSESITY